MRERVIPCLSMCTWPSSPMCGCTVVIDVHPHIRVLVEVPRVHPALTVGQRWKIWYTWLTAGETRHVQCSKFVACQASGLQTLRELAGILALEGVLGIEG